MFMAKRCFLIVTMLLGIASQCFSLPAGFEEFYILGRETQIYTMFQTIEATQGVNVINSGNMASIVAFTATMDGQVIYYDHWEDGYEADLLNPVQSTTEIIGNGDNSDGQPPGDPADLLATGETVSLVSDGSGTGRNAYVPSLVGTRGTVIRYDGGDRIISSGGPINIIHANYPQDGSWIGGAWELYAVRTLEQNLRYRVPVGIDDYVNATSPFSEFQSVFLQISAPEDNTTIVVDNGTDRVDFTLQMGETFSSEGFINETARADLQIDILSGTTIYASTPIQAGIITAGPGTFQSRFFQLIPEVVYGTDYISPVPSLGGTQTELYLFNPSSTDIQVTAWDSSTGAGGDTFTIPGDSAVAYSDVVGPVPASAVRLQSSSLFWGIGSGDSGDTAYDWGYSLIPQQFYDRDMTSAWAPGSLTLTNNYSPLYIAPTVDGTVFQFDVDGDGTFDQIDTNGDGVVDAGPYTADVLDYIRVFDTDNDQSGIRVVANDPFISAYGADPSQGNAAGNLDWGYTVLPLSASFLDPVITIQKDAAPVSLPFSGGTVVFTLTASSYNHGPVTNVDIVDNLPPGWNYTANTAYVTYPDGDTYPVEPAISGQTLTWDLSQSLSVGQNLIVTFEATIAQGAFDDFESAGYNGGSGWSTAWIEGGESNGPTADYVTINTAGSPTSGTYQIRIRRNRSLERGVDISAYPGTVNVSFQARILSFDGGSDQAYFDVYDGTTWTTLQTWVGPLNEGSHNPYSFDVTAYKNPNFRIRFRTSSSNRNGDYIYIDDVQVGPAVQGYTHTNEASATGQLALNSFEATDSEDVFTCDLLLSKNVNAATTAVGDTLTYTIDVTNSSSFSLSNVVVVDPIPAGTTYDTGTASPAATFNQISNQLEWNLGTFAPGTTTLSFDVTVGAVPPGTIIENQGRATATGLPTIRSDRARTTIVAPSLEIMKLGPSNVEPGGDLDYTLEYRNVGTDSATNVVVRDAIPSNTDYVVGSASAGAEFSDDNGSTWTYSPSGIVDANVTDVRWQTANLAASATSTSVSFSVRAQGVPDGGRVLNWATIDSDETSEQNSNVLFTYVTNVLMTKAGSRSITRPGHLIDFDIDFWNVGGSVVNTVIVTDAIPADSNFISDSVTLSAGVSVLYSRDNGATYSNDDGTALSGVITDVTHLQFQIASLPASAASTASVSFTVRVTNPLSGDTTIENQSTLVTASTTGTVFSNLVSIPTVDLEIAKVGTPGTALPGQQVDYVLTYSNNGSAAATSTVLVDYLPPELTVIGSSISNGGTSTGPHIVTWNLGDLPANYGPATVSYSVTVAATATAGDTLVNTARIGNAIDLLSQNYDTFSIAVQESGVTITPDGEAYGDQGDTVIYAHRLFNTSSSDEALEVRAIHDLWGTAIAIYRDVDGDGAYDAAIDSVLPDTDSDGWYETPVVAAGGEIRLLIVYAIDAEPTAQDGDDHLTTVFAKLLSSPDNVANSVSQTTHVLGATVVTMEYFFARGTLDGVNVGWKTASEIGTAGFHILRSESADGPRELLSSSLIPARGHRDGAQYSFIDESAEGGKLYWYWLRELDIKGRKHHYGPALVDWDGDGMADYWELQMGLSPALDDSSGDLDGDGYTNLQEYERGSDPNSFDDSGDTNAVIEGHVAPERAGVRTYEEGNGTFIIELRTPEVRLNDTAGGILPAIPAYSHGWYETIGAPQLPQKGVFIPLKKGAVVERLEVLAVEEYLLSNSVAIRPVPSREFDDSSGTIRFIETFLRTGDRWTSNEDDVPAYQAGIQQAGADSFLHIVFNPLAYRPLSQELELRKRIVLRLTLREAFPSLGADLQTAAVKVLAAPDWPGYPTTGFYKLRVSNSGLYKITHDQLQAAGWPAGSVGSTNIALFHKDGEIPLLVRDGGDGFGPGDDIVFHHEVEKDKYDDGESLFLSADFGRAGARMGSLSNSVAGTPPTIDTHRGNERYGPDTIYGPTTPGGDDEERYYAAFIWNSGAASAEYEPTLSLSSPLVSAAEEALVRVRLNTDVSSDDLDMDHSFSLSIWNGSWQLIGTEQFDGAQPWIGEFRLTQDLLSTSPKFQVKLGHQAGLPNNFDRAYVDWLDVHYVRTLAMQSGRLAFELPSGDCYADVSQASQSSVVAIQLGLEDDLPLVVENVTVIGASAPYTLRLPLTLALAHRFVIAQEDSMFSADSITQLSADTLHSDNSQTDLLVVAPPSLAASYRHSLPLVKQKASL